MWGRRRGRNDFKKAFCAATKYMIGVVIIVALVSGILFVLLGQSDVPVRDFEVGSSLSKGRVTEGVLRLRLL